MNRIIARSLSQVRPLSDEETEKVAGAWTASWHPDAPTQPTTPSGGEAADDSGKGLIAGW